MKTFVALDFQTAYYSRDSACSIGMVRVKVMPQKLPWPSCLVREPPDLVECLVLQAWFDHPYKNQKPAETLKAQLCRQCGCPLEPTMQLCQQSHSIFIWHTEDVANKDQERP